MSFIGGMLGGGGGSAANYSAQAAPIQTAVTPDQLFVNQRQTQAGIVQQQDLVNLLSNQLGVNKESDVYAQQGQLAQQLQQQALGQGPNPAMAQLAQATSANTANQAALMAGQRGAGANAGLIARQAAMQGGANQQAAVGQGATMQAQQQIAAQQQLGQQQQAMGNTATNLANQFGGALQNYNNTVQGQQGNYLGAIANMNNANVSNASQMNQQNGAMARQNQQFNQQMSNQVYGSATGAGATGMISGLMGAEGGQVTSRGFRQPYAEGGDVIPSDTSDEVIPITAPQQEQKKSGGSPLALLAMLADGGMVPGADISNQTVGINTPDYNQPQSNVGRQLSGNPDLISYGMSQLGKGIGSMFKSSPKPQAGGAADSASEPQKVMNASKGGHVPGTAKVKGDSYSNDNVPAMLSPGEVVIPRRIMQSPDAANKSAQFVAAIIAKNGRRK